MSGLPKYSLEFLLYLKPSFQSSLRNRVSILLSLLLIRDIVSLRFCFEILSIHKSKLDWPIRRQNGFVVFSFSYERFYLFT